MQVDVHDATLLRCDENFVLKVQTEAATDQDGGILRSSLFLLCLLQVALSQRRSG